MPRINNSEDAALYLTAYAAGAASTMSWKLLEAEILQQLLAAEKRGERRKAKKKD